MPKPVCVSVPALDEAYRSTLKGVDLGRGFRVLEINCQRNQERGDFMRQRFHERPGLKRKRLHSLRWRKRFKEGFRAVGEGGRYEETWLVIFRTSFMGVRVVRSVR
jgi:hypothetical protein